MKTRNTIVHSFSVTKEQDEDLNEILKVTGMTRSQFVQAAIEWCKKNPTHINGLVKQLADKAGDKWLTSHNVGYDEKDPCRVAGPSDVSSNTYQNLTKEELDRLLEIAQTPWIEVYQ